MFTYLWWALLLRGDAFQNRNNTVRKKYSKNASNNRNTLCSWWESKSSILFTFEPVWVLLKTGRVPVITRPSSWKMHHMEYTLAMCPDFSILIHKINNNKNIKQLQLKNKMFTSNKRQRRFRSIQSQKLSASYQLTNDNIQTVWLSLPDWFLIYTVA